MKRNRPNETTAARVARRWSCDLFRFAVSAISAVRGLSTFRLRRELLFCDEALDGSETPLGRCALDGAALLAPAAGRVTLALAAPFPDNAAAASDDAALAAYEDADADAGADDAAEGGGVAAPVAVADAPRGYLEVSRDGVSHKECLP